MRTFEVVLRYRIPEENFEPDDGNLVVVLHRIIDECDHDGIVSISEIVPVIHS